MHRSFWLFVLAGCAPRDSMSSPELEHGTTATHEPMDPSWEEEERPHSTSPPVGDVGPHLMLCSDNDDCDTGFCYPAGVLGGFCNDCSADADCTWGCSPPNPFADPPTVGTCNDGNLGAGCQTDEACVEPLQCVSVLESSVFDLRGCSECAQHSDCPAGGLCSIDLRLFEVAGERVCVEIGSKVNGETCDVANGGIECMSTHCADADGSDWGVLGVCSACDDRTGDGCGAGQKCAAPTVDLDGSITPGRCV